MSDLVTRMNIGKLSMHLEWNSECPIAEG